MRDTVRGTFYRFWLTRTCVVCGASWDSAFPAWRGNIQTLFARMQASANRPFATKTKYCDTSIRRWKTTQLAPGHRPLLLIRFRISQPDPLAGRIEKMLLFATKLRGLARLFVPARVGRTYGEEGERRLRLGEQTESD